jgi:multiple sugar transport system substrate-binding protein
MLRLCRLWILGGLLLAGTPLHAQTAEPLRLVLGYSTAAHRTLNAEEVAHFQRFAPDVIVDLRQELHENIKTDIGQFLDGRADVVIWFGGERLNDLVQHGEVRALNRLPLAETWLPRLLPSVLSAVTMGGNVYGLPLRYYHWGFYYSAPLFRSLGLTPPSDWAGFLAMCDRLQQNGVTPIAIGTRFPWTAAGWFDYFSLRLNGLDMHRQLLLGQQSFRSARLRRVLEKMATLPERCAMTADHGDSDWRQVVPELLRQRAGVMLTGNFVMQQVPDGMRDDVGFFPFPVLDDRVPLYENAPTDIVIVPAKAPNAAAAGRFLAFLASRESQQRQSQALRMLPTIRDADIASYDPIAQQGHALLRRARGTAQFFDRDALPAIRDAGLAEFARLFGAPERIDAVINALEAARQQGRNGPGRR